MSFQSGSDGNSGFGAQDSNGLIRTEANQHQMVTGTTGQKAWCAVERHHYFVTGIPSTQRNYGIGLKFEVLHGGFPRYSRAAEICCRGKLGLRLHHYGLRVVAAVKIALADGRPCLTDSVKMDVKAPVSSSSRLRSFSYHLFLVALSAHLFFSS